MAKGDEENGDRGIALVSATQSSRSGTRLRIFNPAGEAEDGEFGAIVFGFLNGFH
jgi:hypothetical protein